MQSRSEIFLRLSCIAGDSVLAAPGRGIAAAVVFGVCALAGCGFHLRGTGGGAIALPAVLATVRVVPPGAAANDPFTVAIRDALTEAGTRIVTSPDAPALVLLGEKIESRVAAVNVTTAKASQYLLLYSTGFRLDGPRPIAAQNIVLQRLYSFDPTQVLAKEQEEQELTRSMRSDAAQQIMRRLARLLAAPAK